VGKKRERVDGSVDFSDFHLHIVSIARDPDRGNGYWLTMNVCEALLHNSETDERL